MLSVWLCTTCWVLSMLARWPVANPTHWFLACQAVHLQAGGQPRARGHGHRGDHPHRQWPARARDRARRPCATPCGAGGRPGCRGTGTGCCWLNPWKGLALCLTCIPTLAAGDMRAGVEHSLPCGSTLFMLPAACSVALALLYWSPHTRCSLHNFKTWLHSTFNVTS